MRVTIIGRLGRDPESAYTPDGTLTCRFSLAEDGPKDRSGNKTVDWWDCIAFRGSAEVLAKYAMKGTQVCVFGKAGWREYQGKDGQPRKTLSVQVLEVQLLSRPTGGERVQEAAGIVREAAASTEVHDDLPF